MNASHEHLSEDLLARYFAQTASGEEINSVERWRDLSPANARELDHYRQLWETTASLATNRFRVDTDLAWAKVKGKMGAVSDTRMEPAQADTRKQTRAFAWTSYAAAAVISLAVLAFAWFTFEQKGEPEKLSFATTSNTVERTLPDGTRVFLNYNSSITYPEHFEGDIRAVSLEGEAFFEVKPDHEHPFVISAGGTEVKVLGTSFNVKAYREKPVRVDVSTGKVRVSKDHRMMDLVKGQGAEVTAGTIRSLNADANILGYRTQVFEFESTSLADAIAILKEGYHTDIQLANASTAQCRLTIRFEKETLDATLSVIAETLGLQVRKEGSTYWLDGSGCQ
ncbi:FecR family protein [Dyadobacter sandarakinus]|uniref:FecR domain-containing protein n=1 Tax=Dyadobacter sandarakinus TaxID=2747268 RepID=A0ABX7IFP6_9BACT|nr:FecR domain-containing protein [Dyadobacter sandarakinus]QRR03666.1 FecR domain-containing protein [Dyadobacter sandarakinus]